MVKNIVITVVIALVLGWMGSSDYEAELKTQAINATVYSNVR